MLIFGDEQAVPEDAQTTSGRHFVSDSRRILELLAQRHGFPRLH